MAGELGAHQGTSAQGLAEALESGHLVGGRADDRELETLGHPDVAPNVAPNLVSYLVIFTFTG